MRGWINKNERSIIDKNTDDYSGLNNREKGIC